MNIIPFLSIIIPVYNVKEYLHECLESIVHQETIETAIEIILVDDGSTDGSSEICDEYAAKYDRVIVIHKENGGASDARNMGIKRALGKYLLFIDADDYITHGSLAKIIQQMYIDGGCDVTFLNADAILKNNKHKKWAYTYDKNLIYKKTKNEVLTYIASTSRFPVSPCIKLLRREFVLGKKIFYTKGIICEDVDHMIQLLLAAKSFNCFDFPYYCARTYREGSVMTSGMGAGICFASTQYIFDKWLPTANLMPEYKEIVYRILAVQYLYLIAMYHKLPIASRKSYKKDVLAFSWLLRYGQNKIFLPARTIFRIFGLRISASLFSTLLL